MSAFKAATLAVPFAYTPTSESTHQKYPVHLAMGRRTIFVLKAEGEQQFLVFKEGFDAQNDPRCTHVMGSGSEPGHALFNAKLALARALLKPADFQSRLTGCTFTTTTDKSTALKHVVLNSDGVELGRGEYREVACKQALHRMLIGATDATLEEFKAISVVVNIERGGKGSYGWLYADTEGQSAVRQLVHVGFVANSTFREAAAACLESQQQKAALKPVRPISRRAEQRNARQDVSPVSPENRQEGELFAALLQKVDECLLSQPTDKDLIICPLTPEDGLWIGEIVAHTSNISPVTALRNAHEQFVASAAQLALIVSRETIEVEVEHDEAPSPTM